MKKVLLVALAAILVFGLVACGTPAPAATDAPAAATEAPAADAPAATEAPAADAGTPVKVAVLLKPLSNEYWSSMKTGVEAWAKENGITVDVYAAESEENIAGQLEQMENIISKDYNAICAAPLTAANLVEGVIKASEKGIPVVNVDETIDFKAVQDGGGSMVGQYTTDNVKVGEKAGEFIAKTIGEGQVAIIEGTAGNVTSNNRVKGATDYLKGQKGFEVVASQPGNWDRLVALDVATNIMQTYPDVKAFYCANDTMALGVYEAVANANKTDKIIVVGTDAVQGAKESVAEGKLTATVGQDNVGIGIKCVEMAVQAVKDGWVADPKVEIPINFVDSYLVTKDNAADYLK
ncbi:MAG: substrate-binding domain-containing protein [Christensenellaceae bacterium]